MTFYKVAPPPPPAAMFGPFFDGDLGNLFLSPGDSGPFNMPLPPVMDANFDYSAMIITSETLGFDYWTNSTNEVISAKIRKA